MSASFTPGPWHRFKDEINDAGGLTVARFVEFVPQHRAKSDANANLIAAAPDMVAALDGYADQLCEGWCEQSPDCAHFDDCGGCLARRVAWQARGGKA
jgi:hypothetical protein